MPYEEGTVKLVSHMEDMFGDGVSGVLAEQLKKYNVFPVDK